MPQAGFHSFLWCSRDTRSILHPCGNPALGPPRTMQHGAAHPARVDPGQAFGFSVPRQDAAVMVAIPMRLQLPASCAWALSITFITPCSVINREESKDPKAVIVINNHLATVELIFHQGLLLASSWNGREKGRVMKPGSMTCGGLAAGEQQHPANASCLVPLLPTDFRATAKPFLVAL